MAQPVFHRAQPRGEQEKRGKVIRDTGIKADQPVPGLISRARAPTRYGA
jgi:hypothetical protein